MADESDKAMTAAARELCWREAMSDGPDSAPLCGCKSREDCDGKPRMADAQAAITAYLAEAAKGAGGVVERLRNETAVWVLQDGEWVFHHYEASTSTEAAATILALSALLREAREGGLIYWEPQTERGRITKADMLARIDAALGDAP